MSLFESSSILVCLAALLSYVNYRFIRLPNTIGLMLIALILSLGVIIFGKIGLGTELEVRAAHLLASIDFEETLLHGMLSFLLFAGALHVDLNDLAKQKYVISLLATVGVITSTFLVGSLSWFLLEGFGMEVPFMACLLFGALISPTDPIAVLGILKKAGAPKTLETKIVGESLFNDGVGVVVFLVLLSLVNGEHSVTPMSILGLFVTEVVGGFLFGLATGALAYWMLKSVDNYQVEVLITLALVTGGYALAEKLHISAPIAIVVAGLLIGNHGRLFAMSDKNRVHLFSFWELIDEILNAVLFLLIGLEVLVLSYTWQYFWAGLCMIPLVLTVRSVSVGIPVLFLKRTRSFSPGVVKVLAWAGLRGGISVALALALPPSPHRELFLTLTYSVVVFSIVVQGLTIGKLLEWIDK